MVLVPYWVENVLKRNRLKFADVLNYAKMRELMSVEDVSAFLHFQSTGQIAPLQKCGRFYFAQQLGTNSFSERSDRTGFCRNSTVTKRSDGNGFDPTVSGSSNGS